MGHYAWSNFDVERNEFGQATKTIKAGEEVSQADLDVSDEQWEELIEAGAVREEEYPETEPGQSPAEYYAANPEEGETEEGEVQEVKPSPAPQVKPSPPQTSVPPVKPDAESKPAAEK